MSITEKLATVAENEQKVYDAGKEDMNEAWWKANTANYTRTGFDYGFAHMDFTYLGGFNPPITIKPEGYSSRIFWGTKGIGEITKDKLDLSLCTTMDNMFASSGATRIELIDTKSCSTIGAIFNENYFTATVDKFILKDDGSQTISQYAFNSAYALTNIAFEGVIGSDIWFTYCSNLTRESAINLFKALKDYSGTGTTHTVDLHTSCINRLFEEDKAIATEKGWTIT